MKWHLFRILREIKSQILLIITFNLHFLDWMVNNESFYRLLWEIKFITYSFLKIEKSYIILIKKYENYSKPI